MKSLFYLVTGIMALGLQIEISEGYLSSFSNSSFELEGNLMNDKTIMNSAEYEVDGGIGFVHLLGSSDDYESFASHVSICGNGIVEANEVCDNQDFRGATCGDYSFPQGVLSCRNNCQEISTENCSSPIIYGGGGGSYERTYVFRGVSSGRKGYLDKKSAAQKRRPSRIRLRFDEKEVKKEDDSFQEVPLLEIEPEETLDSDFEAMKSISSPIIAKTAIPVWLPEKKVKLFDPQQKRLAPVFPIINKKYIASEVFNTSSLKEERDDTFFERVVPFLETVEIPVLKNTYLFLEADILATRLINNQSLSTSLQSLTYKKYISLLSGGFDRFFEWRSFFQKNNETTGFINYIVKKSVNYVVHLYPSFVLKLNKFI